MGFVRLGVLASGLGIALALGAQTSVAAQNGPPIVNVEATCRASEQTITKIFGDTTVVTFGSCMRQEREALELLRKEWATYPAEDRASCVRPKLYMPNYVEWHSCLETRKHLRGLRAREGSNQSGNQ